MEFDKETHIYSQDGKQYPSVTQIIHWGKQAFYPNDGRRERGEEIHRMIDYYDTIGIDSDDPHLYQWKEYLKSGVTIVDSERRFIEESWGYAGTVDKIILQDGKYAILDIKTGAYASWHKMQVAAYCHAAKIEKGVLLYIKEDGFEVKEIDSMQKWIGKFFVKLSEYKGNVNYEE